MPEGFKIASAWVSVSPDLEGFDEELEAGVKSATEGAEAKVKIGADKSELDSALAEAKGDISEFDGKTATAKLGADKADLDAAMDDAGERLDEFGGRHEEATLGLDAAEFDAVYDDADARLDEMDGREGRPRLTLDDDEFNEKLDEDEAKLKSANSESGSGSLVGAVTMGIGALLPGLGGAVSGLGLLGAAGGIAFKGIGSALSAAHQASQNTGTTSAQLASTAFSNAVAIQQANQQVAQSEQQAAEDSIQSAAQIAQAQQSVAQAHEQAAQDAQSSAASIEEAEMNVASTERNAAASQIQALESVQNAQQQQQQATYNLSEANYQLGQAYVTARQNIINLNDALADSKLNVQSATLAVAQAEQQQLLVDQNAYSTDLDRQQAALAVAQAKQQLQDATDQESQSQTAANLANQQGVDGSQTVIQAKQAQLTATEGVSNANQAYADAVRNLSLTEINNAQQVKEAQLQLSQAQAQAAATRERDAQAVQTAEANLAQAQQQAAYQQMRDQQSVAQAQENVKNTLREQQLQQAATASTANQSANQFAKDMANLTPAARNFVNQILGMRGAWRQFEDAVQNAVLPGATSLLQGFQSLLPTIESGVTRMGSVLSGMMSSLAKSMESAGGQKVLQGLINNGIQFAQIVLPAFGSFLGQLATLGSKNGAVTGLADALAGISRGLAGFAKGLTPYIPAFDQILQAVGKIAQAVGPALAQDIGAVANALLPLAKFLNSKTGGPFISGIGQAIAAIVTFKGAMRLLPNAISGPLSDAASGLADLLLKPFKNAGKAILNATKSLGSSLMSQMKGAASRAGSAMLSGLKSAASKIPGLVSSAASGISSGLSSAWSGTAAGFTRVFGEGGLVRSGLSTAAGWASGFASSVGSAMAGAASSVASFVAGVASKMAQAAAATAGWIAKNAVAAATYIGENIAEAASATAAFIAENAATLGLGVAIAALVTGIVYLATHWKQSWDAMKDAAETVWNDALKPVFDAISSAAQWLYNNGIKPQFQAAEGVFHDLGNAGEWLWNSAIDPAFRGIASIAEWLYSNGIRPQFQAIENLIHDLADVANWLWHNVFSPVFSGIEQGATGFVSNFGSTWGKLEGVFKTPVNFLITKVYDDGIRPFWNDVVNAVGLKSLDLPNVKGLAGGGVIPGYAPGHDTVPAMLSPGEAVLTPGATRAVGESTIHALNAAHPPSGGGGGGKRGGVHHFAPGGIVPSWLSGAAHDVTSFVGSVVGGAIDTGKILAALATGNTTALTNALGKFIGTDATAAGLAKVMTAIPKTLAGDLVKAITSAFSSSSSGGSLPGGSTGAVGSLPENWHTIASFLATHGFTKYAAAGVAGNVLAESGGNPEQLEIGGGGGGGLIQWTPYPAGYITGNVQQDLMTQLNAILSWGGGPGIVNRATSPSNAAMIYQDYYEKPANLTASLPTRMAGANAVYKAMNWGTFDSGGVLPPGPTLAVNQTGQPETVLTAQQWADIHAIAVRAQGGAAGTGQGVTVVNNWNGPQMPTPEMQAQMDRRLALQLSGG